jgi:cyclohexanecarboxylate-CoA ligase
VVPRDPAPTLPELRDHLRALGMSQQYWPDRLHLLQDMPLTSSGKIQKYLLQEQLQRQAPTAGDANAP